MSSVNIHTAFIPLYIRALKSTSYILSIGSVYTTSRSIPEYEVLSWRLAPDMNPLSFQVQNICNIARNLVIIVAGTTLPPAPDNETSIAELQERIAKTVQILEGTTKEMFEGSDKKMVEVKALGMVMEGIEYVQRFGLPNFYFHVSMVYAIFRGKGAPIGKRDYLSSGTGSGCIG